MMDLHENSSFQEVSDYVRLCNEHRILTVRLNKPVYEHVKALIRPFVGKQAFSGVKFERKKCVES